MGKLKLAKIKALLMDKTTNSPIVILEVEGTSRVIPIWIGNCEAWVLAMALEKMDFPRPLTHDLLLSCVENLNARLEKVVIHSVKDNTYYASLYLVKDEEELLEIDSRPSDAMVLAVKTGVPIFVTTDLIIENGIELFESEEESEEDKEFKKFVENLDIEQFKKIFKDKNREEKEEEGDED